MSGPAPDDVVDITRHIAAAERAAREEFERRLSNAHERYMRDPEFRARIACATRALSAEGDVESYDRAHDLAIRAVVAADNVLAAYGPRRGRIAVVGDTVDDVRAVATAAGIDLGEVVAYTPLGGAQGAVLRGAVVSPAVVTRIAQGDSAAYEAFRRMRRDLTKTGLRL